VVSTATELPAAGFRGRHILSITQFSREDLDTLFRTADEIDTAARHGLLGTPLAGKVLVSAFFDSSTRTRLAHESAMARLGGGVIGFADASVTRAGGDVPESALDIYRMLALYGDVIVTRHPITGTPEEAARHLRDALVVNAGDGVGEHPTQTLADLYTMWQRFGHLDGLHVAVGSDLRMRCVRSLLRALRHFDVTITGVPAPGMDFDPDLWAECTQRGQRVRTHPRIRDVLGEADVVYLSPTVIDDAPEVPPGPGEPVPDGDTPVTAELLHESAHAGLVVLHPLPRKGELHRSVDDTPHNGYWQQARNGVLVRMAMLTLMFADPGP
jgi:aspartate carbamoyltransferase catalytic subunit